MLLLPSLAAVIGVGGAGAAWVLLHLIALLTDVAIFGHVGYDPPSFAHLHVGPRVVVVAVLGASGAAWAAGLKPYSPWLLGGSFLLLAYGFWSVYRVPKSCVVGSGAGRRWGPAAVRSVLWLAAILWLAAVAVNLFLGP